MTDATVPSVAAAQPSASGAGPIPVPDGGIKAYAKMIWSRIERAKPKGMSDPGVAVATFAVSADGSLAWARISESSGTLALDRSALECLRKAAPFPPPPAGARPDQLVFSVPFAFR